METAVGAAGALPVLICTAILALVWAIPQCFFVAELSSMFDVNGGFVLVRGTTTVAAAAQWCVPRCLRSS